MKILFGVQATGNGHITRARALNRYLKESDIQTDFLFSGRRKEKFFDMDEFGDWRCHEGLTFVHEAGELKFLRTLQRNSIGKLIGDISKLKLKDYDLILTDFEPITAWAARLKGKPCLGIGHQYAFNHKVPCRGDTWLGRAVMKNFAPAANSLGLHWHHFGQPILPPIAETHQSKAPCDPNKIIVYLGFEDTAKVIEMLEPFEDHLFVFYGPFTSYETRGHILLKPLSREGFKQDLATSSGVICNAGFELSSEAIQLGKKLLVKPLMGQVEQLSNSRALEELGLAKTMDSLDNQVVGEWLRDWHAKRVVYPDVARALVNWIGEEQWKKKHAVKQLAYQLWSEVEASGVDSFDTPLPFGQLA
ncbi:MAG: glycosyltransferase [Cellvibrionaceae bacterium]|nr:glycosyltransferase [Cellvibrionaceae bacterium]